MPSTGTPSEPKLHIVREEEPIQTGEQVWVTDSHATTGDGNGGGGGDDMDKDYVDAQIDVVKAETSEKIGLLHSDISILDSDVKHLQSEVTKKPGFTAMFGFSTAVVAAVLGGGSALLQFSNDGFDVGFSTSSAYAKELEASREEFNNRLDKIEAKSDKQIDRLEKAIVSALAEKK